MKGLIGLKITDTIKRKINDLKIPVRYKKSFYDINVIDGTYILGQLSWLFTRRVLRCLKRITHRSKEIIIVIICAIIFYLLMFRIGLILEKYSTWYEALWDLRTFFLTSIFIVIVNTNVNEENKRRDRLKKQFRTYKSYVFDSESYLKNLINLIGIPYSKDIFLTDKHLEEFQKELAENGQIETFTFTEIERKKYKNVYMYLISVNKKQILNLRNFLQFVELDISDIKKDKIYDWIVTGINQIEDEILIIENIAESYTPNELADFIKSSLTYNQYIIAELRRPWRWDHQRNMEIRQRIILKGNHIGKSFDSNEYWI